MQKWGLGFSPNKHCSHWWLVLNGLCLWSGGDNCSSSVEGEEVRLSYSNDGCFQWSTFHTARSVLIGYDWWKEFVLICLLIFSYNMHLTLFSFYSVPLFQVADFTSEAFFCGGKKTNWKSSALAIPRRFIRVVLQKGPSDKRTGTHSNPDYT